MKKLIFILVLFFTFFGITFSQDEPDDNKFTLALNVFSGSNQLTSGRHLEPGFKEVFNSHGHSSLVLSVTQEKISEKVVEGMENITYVEYLIKTNFFSKYGDEKFKSTRKIKGKGADLAEAMTNAFNNFAKNKNNFPSQLDSINVILHKKYIDNCEKVIAKKYSDDSLYVQLASLKYIPKKSPCYNKAQQKIADVTKQQSTISCKESLRKMNIRIESKTFDANMLVRQLVDIPGDSPCAAEALALAKKIGKEMPDKLNSASKNQLNIYINAPAK